MKKVIKILSVCLLAVFIALMFTCCVRTEVGGGNGQTPTPPITDGNGEGGSGTSANLGENETPRLPL